MENIKEKKVFFLDLDGTIYIDGILFDNIKELMNLLKLKKKKFYFLSNNSSISTNDYFKKLKDVGLYIWLRDKKNTCITISEEDMNTHGFFKKEQK